MLADLQGQYITYLSGARLQYYSTIWSSSHINLYACRQFRVICCWSILFSSIPIPSFAGAVSYVDSFDGWNRTQKKGCFGIPERSTTSYIRLSSLHKSIRWDLRTLLSNNCHAFSAIVRPIHWVMILQLIALHFREGSERGMLSSGGMYLLNRLA